MDDESLQNLRFAFQKILIPIVVLIGCVGNAISCVVLTRRRMRCSTNIYLTALALVDILFLLLIFILTFQHHQAFRESGFEVYWHMFGVLHWLCDASAYTSIYLTVSFTIERFIAVCHPIRGQVFCTESRAKKVISAVVVLCFLSTLSTAFEQELSSEVRYYSNITGRLCNGNATESDLHITHDNIVEGCESRIYLTVENTALGNNSTYKKIFFTFSSIVFTIAPLIILSTFNYFLIAAVHRSSKLRKDMTNNSRQNESASSQQENKITIILIAVCVLFFICQSPTASFLIYEVIVDPVLTNTISAIGNVFNFLITLNAACNFIIYCVLSDKYRKTCRQLFCSSKSKNQTRVPLVSMTQSTKSSEL